MPRKQVTCQFCGSSQEADADSLVAKCKICGQDIGVKGSVLKMSPVEKYNTCQVLLVNKGEDMVVVFLPPNTMDITFALVEGITGMDFREMYNEDVRLVDPRAFSVDELGSGRCMTISKVKVNPRIYQENDKESYVDKKIFG